MADLKYPVSKPHLTDRERRYVVDAVDSGWVSSLGPYISTFEQRFADFCNVRFALATSNGTTCLHLAIEALGLGPEDEVIVPDLTFVATANAVTYSGATPVMVDIDPETLCLDVRAAERAITPRTKAIIPVHLYGHPADMDAIDDLAKRHGLVVIEDAAEAHGAEYKGRRVGGLGRCGVFSFYGNKIITSGEGGMLTTNDEAVYLKAKSLRDHAMDPNNRYWHGEVGFNYRMTNLQAALGVAQLEQISDFIGARSEIVAQYQRFIAPSEGVRLGHSANWAQTVPWMVCLEVDWFSREMRDRFMLDLRAKGIDTRPYFHPLSTLPMYRGNAPCPVAAKKSAVGLNLPTYVGLTRDDVRSIAETVNDLLETRVADGVGRH
jgi:perosamine synthetase